MKVQKILLGLVMVQILFVCGPPKTFCQKSSASGQTAQGIAIAGLVGDWGFGHSLMLTYLDHGTGNYSHSGNIYGMKYVIKADGSFVYKFAARYGLNTIREWGAGSVVISRDLVTFKFDQGPAEKYRFFAVETSGSGETVLTLTQLNDTSQPLKCGHNKGYFNCTGRQEWKLRRRS